MCRPYRETTISLLSVTLTIRARAAAFHPMNRSRGATFQAAAPKPRTATICGPLNARWRSWAPGSGV